MDGSSLATSLVTPDQSANVRKLKSVMVEFFMPPNNNLISSSSSPHRLAFLPITSVQTMPLRNMTPPNITAIHETTENECTKPATMMLSFFMHGKRKILKTRKIRSIRADRNNLMNLSPVKLTDSVKLIIQQVPTTKKSKRFQPWSSDSLQKKPKQPTAVSLSTISTVKKTRKMLSMISHMPSVASCPGLAAMSTCNVIVITLSMMAAATVKVNQ
mmetsp:Transcript_99865/g.288385  ORF Transcript_99865/g.288385 Transcript_99865/m.288385 type:complete len:215 (+) Transcript_99865:716-1360(+)